MVSNCVNDTLQFLPQEEGRIRLLAGSNSPVYDYFIKDHLGNVRMVLTEEQKQDVYPAATLEDVVYNGGKAIDVESQFYYVDPNKVVASSGVAGLPTYQNNNGNPPYNSVNPYSNTSANSTKVYLTNANSNKMGLGIILKVMVGDKVNIYGKSYHKRPPGQGYKDAVSPLTVLDILNAFSGTALITAKGVSSGDISSRPGFPNSVAGLVGNQPGQSKNQPKASIDWILFDEQFGYAGGGFDMVGAENTSNGTFKEHNLNTIPTITVPKNGYIYVYCANESQYDVFFDNLQVIHTRGPIVEETHYYPFGLTMAGISSKALTFGGAENKKRYNGIDFENELELNIYDAQFRELDAQVGRWWQIDPVTDGYEHISPYASMYNNPISTSDPLGDQGQGCCLPGVFTWMFDLADRVLTSKQRENATALGKAAEKTFKQMGANAKANWNAGNTPLHDIMANPISIIDGSAEVNILNRTLRLEVRTESQIVKTVERYEVGIAKDLSKASVKDNLDVHHTPQSQPAKQVIPDYDKQNAPAIALPQAEHKAIPTLKGTANAGSARNQLAKDIRDLRNYTNAPNSSLEKLIQLNKEMYEDLFKKQPK